jgi:hypothetical protein
VQVLGTPCVRVGDTVQHIGISTCKLHFMCTSYAHPASTAASAVQVLGTPCVPLRVGDTVQHVGISTLLTQAPGSYFNGMLRMYGVDGVSDAREQLEDAIKRCVLWGGGVPGSVRVSMCVCWAGGSIDAASGVSSHATGMLRMYGVDATSPTRSSAGRMQVYVVRGVLGPLHKEFPRCQDAVALKAGHDARIACMRRMPQSMYCASLPGNDKCA